MTGFASIVLLLLSMTVITSSLQVLRSSEGDLVYNSTCFSDAATNTTTNCRCPKENSTFVQQNCSCISDAILLEGKDLIFGIEVSYLLILQNVACDWMASMKALYP